MQASSWAAKALSAVALQPGLALAEVLSRLAAGLRLGDVGQRMLAYYLGEMEARGLHQALGHASTAQFAEAELDLDRRRTGELLRLGRKLLELPAIDKAFCTGRIGWSKVLLLMRVVVPQHEHAWLERALELSCRDLALQVRLTKEGAAPGEHKGLPDVRFRMSASLDVLTWQKLELAKQKLSAELGRAVGDAELLQEAAELLLQTETDGSMPGRTRVDASLYRILLRGDDGSLLADTELGPVPIDGPADDDVLAGVRSACVRCDGECVGHPEAAGRDVPTPPALRRRILARDGACCRCCGSRRQLMVHHIRYRSRGGRTKASNLITLCTRCHALVHADLLVLRGRSAARVRFHDAKGRRLGSGGRHVVPTELGSLLELEPPAPSLPDAERAERPAPQAAEVAFAGLVGQEDLLARLELAARGSLARGSSFPHTLFVGPPGTGKTTLARAIATRCGAHLTETAGPLLQDVGALRALLRDLGPSDMLFLDEVHAVPRPVLEVLYQAMAERRIVGVALPAFTVLAATTEDGDLPQALRSRFGLLEDLGFYATEQLAALVSRVAAAEGVRAERSAALHLAASARGTPREALRLLDRVLDHVADEGAGVIARDTVEETFARLGHDEDGLRPAEQRYLAVLRESRAPVPLQRLARMLGASARTLIEHLEPHLFRRGLVGMTPRGRIALP